MSLFLVATMLTASAVEIRNLETTWLGPEGVVSDIPVVTALVRNRSRSACLTAAEGRIVYHGQTGKVLGTEKVQLLVQEVKRTVVNLGGATDIERVPVTLRPKEAVNLRYVAKHAVYGVDAERTTLEVLRVDAIPAVRCGYFPALDWRQQAMVDECVDAFTDSRWVRTASYAAFFQADIDGHEKEAKAIVFRWCRAYGTSQATLPEAVNAAVAELLRL